MENDILTSFPAEGSMESEVSEPTPDVNKEEQVKESPAEPSAEKEPAEKPASPSAGNEEDDSKLPFHKHPKWKAMYESNKEMRQKLEEIERSREEVAKPVADNSPAPAWFTRTHGDDPEVWAEYQSYEASKRQEIKQEILSEQEQRRTQAQKIQQENERANEEALSEMEDEGIKFDRNRLTNFLIELNNEYGTLPMSNGKINFRAALKMMQKMESVQPATQLQERKKLASQTTAPERGTVSRSERPLSLKEVREKSWDELIRS